MKIQVKDILQVYDFYHQIGVPAWVNENEYFDSRDIERIDRIKEWAKDRELEYLDKILYEGRLEQ